MLDTASAEMQQIADWGEDGSTKGDNRLVVEFRTEVVTDAEASAREGRPIVHEVEYVRIISPGDRNNIIDRPVWERDRQRFADRYERWKKRQETGEKITGTPLTMVPWMSRVQVEELAFFKVRTLEDLSNLNDTAMKNIVGGHELRRKARATLQLAADSAVVTKFNNELEKRDGEIAALKAQMQEMATEMSEAKKKKA